MHTIKLTISPQMDCWLNTLSCSTVCLAQKIKEFDFCGSLSLTLCKPQVVLWCHWLVMTLSEWYSEGWVSHEGLGNVFDLQFGIL